MSHRTLFFRVVLEKREKSLARLDLGMIYDIFGRVSGLDNWRFKRVSLKESLLFNEEVKSMDRSFMKFCN